MKKRLLSLLLVCSMILSLFTGLSVTALAGDSDFDIIDGTELYQYTGTDTDVVIPDGITRIGGGAFMNNASIKSVTIPAGVVYIGEGAFEYCDSLTKVTFLGKCTSIDASAFDYDSMKTMEVHCRAEDVSWYSYQGFSDDYIKGDVGGSTETCAHANKTEEVTTPAGCRTAGSKNIVCEDCNEILETVTISALGHLEKDEIITAATCETAGSKNVVCERCKETIKSSVEIPALGHNVVDGKCTRTGCTYTETAEEPAFADFFSGVSEYLTAESTGENAWTYDKDNGYITSAASAKDGSFTLTFKKPGKVTMKGVAANQGLVDVYLNDGTTSIKTIKNSSGNGTANYTSAAYNAGDVLTFKYGLYIDSAYKIASFHFTSVTFTQTFAVTASVSGEGGTVSPTSSTVASGNDCTITITAADGYELDTVKDNETDVTSSVTEDGKYTIENVTAAHNIAVTFKESTVTPSEPDGSAAYPYEIGTAAELIALSDKVYNGDKCENVYYVLTDDIVLDSSTTFRPIGTGSSKYFSGVFDGQNHTISGLNVSYYSNSGLFGYVMYATIKNLTVKGSVIGNSNTGGIVGSAIASTLDSLHNEANVSGKYSTDNYFGGVVGYIGGSNRSTSIPGTTVNNCTNRGTVTGQYNNSSAAYGGIVGYAFATGSVTNTVSNCTNYGDVKSTATSYGYVGGIVGSANSTSSKLTITNCKNGGTLTAPKYGETDDVLPNAGDGQVDSESGKLEETTTYTVTVNVTPTAGGTAVAAPASVESGKSSTITITPNDGYELASLKVDGTDVTASVSNNKYTISKITANTTVTVTFKEKTQTVDYFQKFFETKTNMTAEKVSGWTSANGKTIKASGTVASVFKLTVKEDGYLAVYGTVYGTLAKVNAVNQKNETVGVLATVSMTATQTAFEKAVKSGDVITFTYTNSNVNGTDNYVEITSITLTENCPHTVHPFTEKTDATCTTDGNIAYYKCLTCNKYFSDAACTKELTSVTIPASHTYDESKNVSVDGGKATVKTCSVCKLTTVVAGSGEGTPTYTVTLSGANLTFTAEGKTGANYTVGSGKDFYFLAKVDSGYTITNVTSAAAVEGYDGLYKIANVTGNTTVTLTTAEAPKSEYSFEVRTNEDGTKVAYITGYKGNGGAITLPTEYDDGTTKYNVVGVAKSAFCGSNGSVTGVKDTGSLSKITSITIPAEIKTIEALAFSYVGMYSSAKGGIDQALTTITFQGADTVFVPAVSSTGYKTNSQLSSNTNLTTVTLPANLKEIPSALLMGDTALTTLTIPATVTTVGARAFENTGLTSVTMNSTTPPTMEIYDVSSMSKSYPFRGCTVTISVPNGTLEAYKTAWADMLNATDKTLTGYITLQEQGGNIGYISDFTVDGITYKVVDLTKNTVEVKYVAKNNGQTLTIPATVDYTASTGAKFQFTVIGIGEKAMEEYKSDNYTSSAYWFTKVEFPDTLTYLGKWSCAGLNKVTEIDLSNTKVKTIGSFAFNNCESLETIKLPATLATFGAEKKTETKKNADQTGNDTNTGDYDGGSESNKKFDGKQEESVSYTENVFMGCQSLQNILVAADNPNFKDVDGVLFTRDGKTLIRYPVGKPAAAYTIPDGTEIIEECAFMQIAGNQANGALKSVTFPDSLKKIEDGAFRQSSLTSVQLPANVTFGSYIFDCSKSLTTVTTESGVTEIPAKAFWGCEALKNVTLADSVKTIGESAFERAGFTSIDLNKVTTIGKYAFYFSKLTSVTVPAAAECDTGAFMNCPALATATVNGTKLGKYMFWYCTDLESLNAPNVTTIDEGALGYCVKLTSLPLAKVTSIGHGAFRNCHALTSVTIPSSVQSFGKYVFADCGKLSSVTFAGNASVTSLPEGTFYECLNLREVHLGDYISQTEGLSLYMAGWNNSLTVNVYCNQPEEYFFRNEFDTCFIDLGNQQLDNEDRDIADESVVYVWTRTEEDANGNKTYYFKTKSSGGCGGGGCGGGGSQDANGMTEYFMKPSVTANFHFATDLTAERVSALYSALPTVLTVEIRDKKTNQTVETYYYTLPDLESMAQTTTAGYQYVGMKGWAVMAATEYVTIDDLIGGEPLTGTDTITLYAGDGATYSATGAQLQQNSYFFPDSNSYTNNKVTSPATPVPAIIALEWNTGKIETTPDSSALSAVARTAYKSTNLRFAHGLSAANYMALDDCTDIKDGDVCSAMRMLQHVQKIVVTMDVQKDAQVTVPAVISGTNATVDSSKMSDALDKLADNGLLTVDASNSSSTGLRFTLSGEDVKDLADKNAKLELITRLGSVTLDAASLKGFGGKELVLTIEKLLRSSLSAALQKELDTHAAIYSVSATCGGAAVTSLAGKAQITLPYTLQTGEKAASIRTSRLGTDTLSKLTASYASGSVSFETSVLAKFAVDVPDKQNSVTIILTPVVKDGAASAALPTADAEEALAKLTEGGELILDARTAKTVTASEISIPRSVIQDMIEKKLTLQAVMNDAQVGLDAAALTSAYGKLTGTNFRICAEQLANSDLPKAARSDFQTADLWRVWLTDGTREVTEVAGSVRITLTYTLRKGQSAADMTVYAVNDDGTHTALRATNDKNAYTLSFTGSRLGIFALTDLLDGELPFRDVYTSDWYYDDVRYVYENGLMNGVTTTQFAPKTDITRGMLVTILYRVEGEPAAPANPFKDVASGSYYEDAIAWAETRGIVNGFGGGLFRPNAPITREQFVAILYRYAAYKGLQTTASASLSAFADAASVSGWAVDAVRWAVGSGLMNGKNGKIVPAGYTTRAEAAALLHRYLA